MGTEFGSVCTEDPVLSISLKIERRIVRYNHLLIVDVFISVECCLVTVEGFYGL